MVINSHCKSGCLEQDFKTWLLLKLFFSQIQYLIYIYHNFEHQYHLGNPLNSRLKQFQLILFWKDDFVNPIFCHSFLKLFILMVGYLKTELNVIVMVKSFLQYFIIDLSLSFFKKANNIDLYYFIGFLNLITLSNNSLQPH